MDGSLGPNSCDRNPTTAPQANARPEPETTETVVDASVKPIHWSCWCTWGLPAREAVLVAGMALAFSIAAPFAYYYSGVDGLVGAALALVVCLTGAGVALAASVLLRGAAFGLAGIFVSMTVRTGFPIVLLAIVHLMGGLRNHPSLVYYFLFFYLLALAIETPLSLPSPDRSTQRPETPPHSH